MKTLKIITSVLFFVILIVLVCYSISRIIAVKTPLFLYSIESNVIPEKKDLSKIKVASYNIAHARGGRLGEENWKHKSEKDLLNHLDQLVAQIKDEAPDILVLNEVDFSSAWSLYINQAEYIAQKAGYAHILEQKNMEVSFPFFGLSFGNAVLSKYPIQNARHIDFQPYSKLEDIFAGNHDAAYCEIRLPSYILGLYAVHLESRSEDIRLRSAETIAEISLESGMPIVAMGDFNSTPIGQPKSRTSAGGKNAMSFLFNEQNFFSSVEEVYDSTFPSEKPALRIDWIIGKGAFSFKNSKVIQSSLSDHLMIVSDLEFEKREKS
jgi:endonuclease/exonuclease/phosphatase family metal-dependent hydrolase